MNNRPVVFCPACGEKDQWIHFDKTGQYECPCGMTWTTLTSMRSIDVGTPKSERMKDVLERTLTVFETRNVDTNRERYQLKSEIVDWLVEELTKGPIEGGTLAYIPDRYRLFGADTYDALEKAVLIRDDVCRICKERPSKEVHHIRPKHLKGRDHPRNLIGLCLECHDEVHRRIDRGIQTVLEDSLNIGGSE